MESISLSDPWPLIAVAIAMLLGGILKGATGAGLPVIAIPVITSFYDVRVAVAVMVLPNLITNFNQARKYRAHAVNPGFARKLAVAGAVGAGVGSVFLAWLPASTIQLIMAAIIVAYIGLRLLRPDFRLSTELAEKYVRLAGGMGGILQGAVGISAPVAVTFLNAMRLQRNVFIFTVSTFFATMCLTQIPVLIYFGILTVETAVLGLFAVVPLSIAVPIGEWIGKRFNPVVFDRVILFFLLALAVRLISNELF